MFHKILLSFIRPSGKSIYNIYDPQGCKLLNKPKLGFNHLCEYKFSHTFAGPVNPLCSCALATEGAAYFFLRYQNYVPFHTTLMNELSSLNCGRVCLKPIALLEIILYGDTMLNDKSNHRILTVTINYIKNT